MGLRMREEKREYEPSKKKCTKNADSLKMWVVVPAHVFIRCVIWGKSLLGISDLH